MAYGRSNDDVIDDVAWQRKVKVIIPISLRPVISKTARDRDLVTMGHLSEMACVVSNGHVIDDVTWPKKVKVVTLLYLDVNISKMVRDRDLVPINH